MVLAVMFPVPGLLGVIPYTNDHRGVEVAVHAGVCLFQSLGAPEHEDPLGLIVMGGGSVAACLQNQIQLLLLHRAGIKFPERVSLCGQLFKIHWDSSSFV